MSKTSLSAILSIFLFIIPSSCAHAQEWAKERLEKSQRHLEWVDVKNGDRTLKCFVAYPEVKEKATTVLVIHEIFGMSDWIKELCDELAAEGFVAVAPDLLSGKSGESTSTFKSVDDVRKAVSALTKEQVASDLASTATYASKLPASNGKLAVAGFCWGGAQTWLAVADNRDLKEGFVFYGMPDKAGAQLDKIAAPVLGFFGENDARVTSTVSDTKQTMEKLGKIFQPHIYADAGHGFMRTGEAPDADVPNKKARAEAWSSMIKALHEI